MIGGLMAKDERLDFAALIGPIGQKPIRCVITVKDLTIDLMSRSLACGS